MAKKLFEHRDFETPPTIAEAIGSSPDTIRAAIHSGDLEAVNIGSMGRPTWRISEVAWQAYLEARSSKTQKTRRRRTKAGKRVRVVEFS